MTLVAVSRSLVRRPDCRRSTASAAARKRPVVDRHLRRRRAPDGDARECPVVDRHLRRRRAPDGDARECPVVDRHLRRRRAPDGDARECPVVDPYLRRRRPGHRWLWAAEWRDNGRVDWRRLRARVAVAATAAVISMGAFAMFAVVGSGDGNSRVGAFNACITQTRFLVLVRHRDGNGFGETIKDRVRHTVVGEVVTDRSPTTLGGAAAANGRYVMSTATPLGRDATAIEGCWDRFFPVAPDT
jgi:hypothetical protein